MLEREADEGYGRDRWIDLLKSTSTVIFAGIMGVAMFVLPAAAALWPVQTIQAANAQEHLPISSVALTAKRYQVDIAPQSLDGALKLLNQQTGAQFAYSPNLNTVSSKGAKGRLTVDEALEKLLQGTNTQVQRVGPNTTAIRVAQSAIGQANDGSDIQLDTIVVEGTRSNKTKKDVAPSIFVIDGADVDNGVSQNVRELIQGIANVNYEDGPYLPSIRGIDGTGGVEGGTAITAGSQPRVPIVVDGISLPTSIGATTSITGIWDIGSVEVARGPQATTTGRNAIGGAVRVFTNDPTYEHEAAVRLGYFNQDGTGSTAIMANVPIIDGNVALRLAAEGSYGEAFVDYGFAPQAALANSIDDEILGKIRGKLLFTPESLPGLSVLFSVDHQHLQTTFDPGAIDRNQNALVLTQIGKAPLKQNRTSYSAEVKYDLSENVEFEQRFAHLDSIVSLLPNAGFRPLTKFDVDKDISDTLFRFTNVGIVKRGFIGYSYEGQREDIEDNTQVVDGKIDNHGIFGEVELSLTEALTLLIGGRYEYDTRSRSINQFALAFTQSAKTTDDVFLPKVGVRYEIGPELLLGYTYSEGFRAGGIDFNIFSGPPFFIPGPPAATFDPELLRQHEIFAKGSVNPNFSYGITGFYYTFEDAQVLGASPGAPFLIGNVPEARGLGAEIEVTAKPVDAITLFAGVGLLDTKITDGGTSGFQGRELALAPNLTANGSFQWMFAPGWDFETSFRYVGSQTYRLGATSLKDYAVVDMRLGYDVQPTQNLDLRIEGFIKNVADARYETRDFDGGLFVNSRTVGRPRTFGVTATARF